jgi:hypothetical protein
MRGRVMSLRGQIDAQSEQRGDDGGHDEQRAERESRRPPEPGDDGKSGRQDYKEPMRDAETGRLVAELE